MAERHPVFALGPSGCISLDDIDPPALPGDDWVRVGTTLSGICGTDLSYILASGSPSLEVFVSFPYTLGHENIGKIESVGDAAHGWAVGDRVIVNPSLGCLARGKDVLCSPCARGEYGLCRVAAVGDHRIARGAQIGFCRTVGGGWSSHFVAHISQLHRADDISDSLAVLADPLASALRPVLLHPPTENDRVLVFGAGTIGLLTILSLRQTGWQGHIAAIGRYPFQRELAHRAGANSVAANMAEYMEGREEPRLQTGAAGPVQTSVEPSLVYDTVGSTRTFSDALYVLRERGQVVMVGGAYKVRADFGRIVRRGLQVNGVYAYGRVPGPHGPVDVYERAIQGLRAESIAALDLVSHEFPLVEYKRALLTALDKKKTKCVKVAFRFAA
jgi:L-iditol 2-dehydrogenase